MKKALFIMIGALLVFAGLAAAFFGGQNAEPSPAPAIQDLGMTASPDSAVNHIPATTTPPSAEDAVPDAPAEAKHVDLEALHDLYPEDSVYAVIGEREITWGEYFEWLGTYVLSGEDYIARMAAYGMPLTWDSEYTAGVSLADYSIDNLNNNLRAFTGIDRFAADKGITVSDEELQAKKAEDRAAILGEDADDAAWAELLTQNFLTEKVYLAQAKASLELAKIQQTLYGENGELLDKEALRQYIEDKGYLRCNHILFLTMNMDDRSPLDEETVAAKKAKAEEIAAELQAIDNRELLVERFLELKQELCEDSGKLYYPEGYVFTPGTMVKAFEETTQALNDFEVSAPVLSEYGYHIILRLPVEADTALDEGGTIGAAAASEIMAGQLDEIVDALDLTLAPGMDAVRLTDFVK